MYKSGGCFDRRNSADSATLPLGALDIDENGHVIARACGRSSTQCRSE